MALRQYFSSYLSSYPSSTTAVLQLYTVYQLLQNLITQQLLTVLKYLATLNLQKTSNRSVTEYQEILNCIYYAEQLHLQRFSRVLQVKSVTKPKVLSQCLKHTPYYPLPTYNPDTICCLPYRFAILKTISIIHL